MKFSANTFQLKGRLSVSGSVVAISASRYGVSISSKGAIRGPSGAGSAANEQNTKPCHSSTARLGRAISERSKPGRPLISGAPTSLPSRS